jgi:hypothetical protein
MGGDVPITKSTGPARRPAQMDVNIKLKKETTRQKKLRCRLG